MFKKIVVLTFLSLLSVFLLGPKIYAATTETVMVEEPAANTGGLWHVEDGNRAYVFMRYTSGSDVYETGDQTNVEYDNYDYSKYTLWYGFKDDLSFPNTAALKRATISNPNPSEYNQLVVEICKHMTNTMLPAPSFTTIATYDSVVHEIEINLFDWEDNVISSGDAVDYSYITLSVDGDEILSSKNSDTNPYSDAKLFGVKIYWQKSDTVDPIDPNSTDDPWDSLPVTTGSPANPTGDWGSVSNLIVENQSVSFDIEYLGTTYPVNSFLVDGNLDFINKSNEILYYSDPNTGDRMLYFNFGDITDRGILTVRSFSEIREWKGEALWNLTQNEVKVTDVLNVYNYIPAIDQDGNVYSYFYMPDVPIDNLISVTCLLAYRYVTTNWLGITNEGDIQYTTVSATKGSTTVVNPSWVQTAYTTAYITTAVAAVATAVGWIPGYGWAIAGAAFLVGGALLVADVNEWFAYDVEQIQHVIPDAVLTNQINTYISTVGGSDAFSADTDKLYKLHLANLDPDDTVIMSDLSYLTQVVWETDGEIYVVNEEYINNIEWGGPGTELPDTTTFLNLNLPTEIIWVIAIVGGVVIFNKLKLEKKPGLLIIIVAGVVYILYRLGIISW